MRAAPETLTGAKRRLIDLLKRIGPATAAGLAAPFGLTDVAVRQHLQTLEARGLVTQEKQPPKGRGRPSVHWSLTELAAELFPDRHGDLAVSLIEAAREAFGADGITRLVEIRSREQLAAYRRSVPGGDAPLKKRVQALGRQRTAEGYMAEVRDDGDGGYVLIEHHCPICEAARQCTGLCAAELDVFRRALGDGVDVERTEHLLNEGDRCAYRIRARA